MSIWNPLRKFQKTKIFSIIKSKVLNKNQTPFVMGCPCHMVHNTASKAKTKIGSICNFDVEDYWVDIFDWFKHRTKKKVLLKNFTRFVMSSTGWSSLETAVKRALKLFIPLKSYFLSLDEPQVRFKTLKKHLTIPWLKFTCYLHRLVSHCSQISTSSCNDTKALYLPYLWCYVFFFKEVNNQVC